jgi:predicted outer membrane repeat protein
MSTPLKVRALWLAALFLMLPATLYLTTDRPARAATLNVPCDTASLVAAFNTANTNGQPDTIELASGCTYTLTAASETSPTAGASGLVALTETTTVNGNGATIIRSAAGGTPRFRLIRVVGGVTLTLNNLNLKNGLAELGGAIRADGILNLNNVTLTENRALGENGGSGAGGGAALGGALFVNINSTTTVTGSSFSANCALGGSGNNGGGGGAALGGAIFNQGILNLSGGTIGGNETLGGGDAVSSAPLRTAAPASACVALAGQRATAVAGKGGGLLGGASGNNGGFGGGGGSGANGGFGGGAGANGSRGELGGNPGSQGESRGGGLFNQRGTLGLTGVNVQNNRTYKLDGGSASPEGEGGGLQNYLGNLTVGGGTFSNNFSGDGSALHTTGIARVAGATFQNNEAEYAGSLYVKFNTARLDLSNATFQQNRAGFHGGGIYITSGPNPVNFGPSVAITNSLFDGNNAAGEDGGAINGDSEYTLSVYGSTFRNNTAAKRGGAINAFYGDSSYVTITNSTFHNNTATTTPGAIASDSGFSMSIINSTLVNNPRGIFIKDDNGLKLYNSLLVNPVNCNRVTSQGSKNIEHSAVSCGNASTLAPANPVVGSTSGNYGGDTPTIPLVAPPNPAIDFGNPAHCPLTDQRGRARSNPCDVGAYEYSVDYVVRIPTDGGAAADGDTPDTLSYALKRAQRGDAISFNLNGGATTLTVSGALTTPVIGVQLVGGCGANGGTLTISYTGINSPQNWEMRGVRLSGLKFSGFKLLGTASTPNLVANSWFCVRVQR